MRVVFLPTITSVGCNAQQIVSELDCVPCIFFGLLGRPGCGRLALDEALHREAFIQFIASSQFAMEVKTKLPVAKLTLTNKLTSPLAAARVVFGIPDPVSEKDEVYIASGCVLEDCGSLAGLILARPEDCASPFTLAFASQKLINRGHHSPPMEMNLYIYSSVPQSGISDADMPFYQQWLKTERIDHIDHIFVARGANFLEVATPSSLTKP